MRTETVQNKPLSYDDSIDHLYDELGLLNLRLLRELRIRKKLNHETQDATKGFFVTEEEVLSILQSSAGMESMKMNAPEIDSIGRTVEEVSSEIAAKISNTGSNAEFFPLVRLSRIFGLTPFELGALIIAIAPEIDRRYERIYGYFNDDITKKAPSVDLVFDLLCPDTRDKMAAWRFFSQDAPLLYFDLIHLTDAQKEGGSLSVGFRIDERIKSFIAGNRDRNATVSNLAQLYYPEGFCFSGGITKETKEKIKKIIAPEGDEPGKHVFWLYGKAYEDKKSTVLSICEEFSLPLLTADLEDIFFEQDQRTLLRNIFREAALQSAIVFFTGGDRLYAGDERSEFLKRSLLKIISELSWATFISAETIWMPGDTDGRYHWYPFEFKLPVFAERRKIWTDTVNGSGIAESEIDIISGRFNFSETQIKNAVFYAKKFLDSGELTIDNIYKACGLQSGQKLGVYSKKINNFYTWDDIVLPDDRSKQLREICNYIKHKHLVYFRWGFEKKLALGRGLNVLFSGPSGTGKTMAADIIAHELNLEMYKVDLSSIVSKYIGETEKNLNRIFGESSSGNVILFFDEADALFGKRSEVKDAHDRYANIEINYLLQKMEEHEGIVVLATNFNKNLDEAFARRMHFTVDFPFPDDRQRELILRKIFPEDAPLADDIDYRFLSEKFKLTGGNIKNIALTAAFYAADESSEITMRHVILAVKREMQKLGKLCVKGDFGVYYDLLWEGADQ
ncbi:MAG: ATP-binding protein [Nitrospirota bacterium]|nr:ATP-binding protein [Nitrospirota bacterium]